MTVQELIEELSLFPDDMEVEFAYNYGDYWRTTVCKEIKNIDTGYVEYSAYHRMDKLVDNDDEEYDDEEETEAKREVVLLQ